MTQQAGAVVVETVPDKTLEAEGPAPGSFLQAVADDPDALLYFLVNVGDGDTQLLVSRPTAYPARADSSWSTAQRPRASQVSCSLADAGVIDQPGSPGQIRLLVATHPHRDHIGGMPELLRLFGGGTGCIEEFWEPGYFFPNPSFHSLMTELEQSRSIRRLQPTSGTTYFLDTVKLTVVGPGVGLRTRFDTYGVQVNDASITLMVDYPATQIYTETDEQNEGRTNRRTSSRRSKRLLLGGDAQFSSWAQATVDFPDLQQQHNPVLATELRAARGGRDYLSANLFKLSHHASKHGITLELLERVAAKQLLVSSVAGGGSYNFPHAVAMEAAREAQQAIAGKAQQTRKADHELGIHVTGACLSDAATTPLGSIAAVVPRAVRSPIRLFRLMDTRKQGIDLAHSREIA